jgi:hypothetical protein
MSWGDEDNKHYRGHLDRIYVSRTESWEIGYYIRHFLTSHNHDLSEQNRAAVGAMMQKYPGAAPVLRDDMTAWLKKQFNI